MQAAEGIETDLATTRFPTFLVIGAMRAGTTTLYYELAQHPEVHMAPVKEPNYFAIDNGTTDLPLTAEATVTMVSTSVADLEGYRQLFRGSATAKAIGEVSPSYLYSRSAATRISAALPEVQILALLRDPVDRAYSAYIRRAGAVSDPQAFLEVIESEQQALELGKPLPLYPLVLGGLYAHHLARYTKAFAPSRLWMRLYEDFWASPDRSFAQLHQFIGVSPRPPAGEVRLNRSGVPRFPALDRLIRSGSRVKGYAKRNLPPGVVRSLVDAKQKAEDWSMQPPERLPTEIRERLIDRYFESDIRRLELILGRSLDAWRRV
jgi:hypothetical protein